MARNRWKWLVTSAVLGASLTGCSTGVPFGWGNSGSPFGAGTASNPNSFSSKIAGGWNSFKGSATAPFNSQPIGPTSDATSLSSGLPRVGADIYTSAAALHESQGNGAAALEQYRKALQVAPNDSQVLLGYARLNDRLGNSEEAIRTFTQVTKSEPNNASAFNDLGLCQVKHGQLNEGLTNVQRAAQLQPNNSLYRNNLARLYVQANRNEEAYRELAAVHSPAHAHYNLGYLLSERGDTQGAQHHFSVALQTDPNLVPARQMLARLQGQADALGGTVSQYGQLGQEAIGQFQNSLSPPSQPAGSPAQPTWPPTQPVNGPRWPMTR